ncbi:MAG: MgtC/SapB family protein [Candidatus Aenigmarchaeota archaeon]|nr:MgtC/SapB family protein [Candidatus Aenigmarchaeota archaeon]MCK5334307.1 MgtC/SapB family protein [Candidatus Aenigmarchaeota archaeon]
MFEYLVSYFMTDLVIIFKVLFALLMGLIVGMERQRMRKSAGMRTHIIVCVSTTMVVAVAMAAFPAADSGARAIAAVITGIGFLGAGQIMTSGGKISGITTAASIWANALIGCVIGLGFYLVAFVGTMIMFYTFRLKKGTGWTR